MAEEVKKKNWKTTAIGIMTGVGIIIAQVVNVLDDDPQTVLDFGACAAALAAMGIGWFARDKDVSSSSSGVK